MTSRRAPRIALALAGGGPLGAAWQIGALCALEEALQGVDFTELDHYVGVSAGGFLAAGLANGMAPRALCASFLGNGADAADRFDPAWLATPAWDELARRVRALPLLAVTTAWRAAAKREGLLHALEPLAAALPTGVFASEAIHRHLSAAFARPGRSNDFRQLRRRLTLVATELETGQPVAFGAPGWDHVPVSRAVQATCALPGLFAPVRIDGRDFVDGALTRTMHASVALDQGADLVLCLNPLVPFTHSRAADRGLPGVFGQAIRTMIRSRMATALRHYAQAYPRSDVVVLEPDGADPVLQRAHPFGYAQRRELAEHAYQRTRAWLREHAASLGATLQRHGLQLRAGVLRDDGRRLLRQDRPGLGAALERLHGVLDRLDAALRAA